MSYDERLAPLNLTSIEATNYGACAGAHSGRLWNDPLRDGFRGAMSSDERITISNIRDGLSHTIVFGKTSGNVDARHPSDPRNLKRLSSGVIV